MNARNASDIARRLRLEVIEPLQTVFAGRDDLIELVALAVCAGENLLVVGPPGTAKSEIIAAFAERIGGRYFEYLLTRFTVPSEVFGPMDLEALRQGRVSTRTEGMLPDAELVFLDEVFNAGSAILNSLLGILNEGVFRRGQDVRHTSILSVLAASNRIPDDPSLEALKDRFSVRIEVEYLDDDGLGGLLDDGWRLEQARLRGAGSAAAPTASDRLDCDDLRALGRSVADVDIAALRAPLADIVRRVRAAGLLLSDRRVVKLQRLAATSAVLCARDIAIASDLWPARFVWERPEDRAALVEIVADAIDRHADDYGAAEAEAPAHPLAATRRRPAELSARLDELESELRGLGDGAGEPTIASERVDVISNELQDLDAERRWCRARDAVEAEELDRIGRRLETLAATLDARTTGC